eukprot:EG_transcript_7057
MAPGGVAAKRPEEHLLRLFPLMALIFYEVSGGPFGSEDAVGASSPAIAMLGFIVFPLVWSVPEALITAEMSVMYPEDCGYVAWVSNAFGPFLGFMEGLLSWVSGMMDNALYPVLMVDYFLYLTPSLADPLLRYVTIVAVTAALTYLNYRGLVVVGRMAVFLTVFCMLPFVGIVALGLPQVDPALWRVSSVGKDMREVDWAKFLNIIFWNVNYWDSVSTLAGEVHEPAKTIPRALFLAVILMIVAYVAPLLVGTGICVPKHDGSCAPPSDWKDGYFSKVAAVIGGRPLQCWLLLGAALSNIGLFEAEMCSDSYQIYGMAERGFLPAFCAYRSHYGTPVVGILMSAAGVLFVSYNGFGRIVEMLNFLYCLAALLEFAAFLALRWREPDAHRGFRIPLPLWGCALMLVLPVVMIGVVLKVAKKGTVVVTIGIIVFGCLLYVFLDVCKRYHLLYFLPEPTPADHAAGPQELEPLLDPAKVEELLHSGAGTHHRSMILHDRLLSEERLSISPSSAPRRPRPSSFNSADGMAPLRLDDGKA